MSHRTYEDYAQTLGEPENPLELGREAGYISDSHPITIITDTVDKESDEFLIGWDNGFECHISLTYEELSDPAFIAGFLEGLQQSMKERLHELTDKLYPDELWDTGEF